MTGLELCERFYWEAVRPVLGGMPHSAALLGRGSEVLGFDDDMSTDHDFKPRVLLFLPEGGTAPEGLPADASVHTLRGYFKEQLDLDIDRELSVADWLTIPELQLLSLTAGAVYHDDLGLATVRERLAFYPHDVWLYLLSAAWWRIHPELNLLGRAGYVGDELGSSLIGSRLVGDLMRICFLQERQYAPYSKWYGTAFSRLGCAADLSPVLWKVQQAETWQAREAALVRAYELVAARQNALALTPQVQLEEVRMWDRPFRVLWGDFPTALQAAVKDPAVRSVAERFPIGQVDQLRDILWGTRDRRLLMRIFVGGRD